MTHQDGLTLIDLARGLYRELRVIDADPHKVTVTITSDQHTINTIARRLGSLKAIASPWSSAESAIYEAYCFGITFHLHVAASEKV